MTSSLHHTLRGCGTALATPFTAHGAVDEPALRALVEWQLAQGIHFLVPCGSTGEAATLSMDEHVRVVEVVAEVVAGRVPVVAGAGSNNTAHAIALSQAVARVGATHLLHVTPMYNKPPQRGLVAHFQAIADACPLPIVLYNVPGRTAGNLEAATTLALAEDTRFVAVKEASANHGQIDAILRNRPEGFAVLSGDDGWTLAMMAAGAEGVISVVSNVAPQAMAQLAERCAAGDFAGAREIHARLAPLVEAMFVESNPIPLKAALGMLGKCSPHVRLPLVPLAEAHERTVRAALASAGVFPS